MLIKFLFQPDLLYILDEPIQNNGHDHHHHHHDQGTSSTLNPLGELFFESEVQENHSTNQSNSMEFSPLL